MQAMLSCITESMKGIHLTSVSEGFQKAAAKSEEIDHVCKTLGCKPAENLVADLVQTGSSKFMKVTGINYPDKAISIISRSSNKLMLEEAVRSIHDALCDIRCLVKKRFIIAGGGAPETEVAHELLRHANSLVGADAYCFKAFAEAMKIIPNTLAEISGLRNRHAQGEKTAGINVRKGAFNNILEENVG